MKSLALRVALLLAAIGLTFFTILKTQGQAEEFTSDVPYSTIGHGPKILLLHDSSNEDKDWANAARNLASHFEVTLVDISKIITNGKNVEALHQFLSQLEIDDSHIAGSANGAILAQSYALSYPNHSDSFILPKTSEDLQILADIVNSTPFTKS